MTSLQFTHAQGIGYSRGMYRVQSAGGEIALWGEKMLKTSTKFVGGISPKGPEKDTGRSQYRLKYMAWSRPLSSSHTSMHNIHRDRGDLRCKHEY